MPYAVEYSQPGIVVFKYQGVITAQEAQESSFEGVALAKRHTVQLYLADHSESVMVLPIEKIQDLMDKIDDTTNLSRNAKLAIVLPSIGQQARRDLQSFATFASNQGWLVLTFNTHQEAIDWLMDQND